MKFMRQWYRTCIAKPVSTVFGFISRRYSYMQNALLKTVVEKCRICQGQRSQYCDLVMGWKTEESGFDSW